LLATLALIAAAAATPAPGASWRLTAEPATTAESALRDAAARDGDAGLAALAAVGSHNAGTTESGLAHLVAGLRLEDAGRHADAIGELTHVDVLRTALRDRALFATATAQEALGRTDAAARSYVAAAGEPASAVVCEALPRAAALLVQQQQLDAAVDALTRADDACPREQPAVLLALGDAQLRRGDRAAAAAAFDRLERTYPVAPQARDARARLASLADVRPARSVAERAQDELNRGVALLAAGRTVTLAALAPAEADLARVRLARALLARRRVAEGLALLRRVGADSPSAAEAAFYLAREQARRGASASPYEAVADRWRGTEWGEAALLALANNYQKDALDDAALPWWRRLLAEYPQGRYVERAAWVVGYADFRAGRYGQAAATLESAARVRPPSGATAGLLYWAGRAQLALGDTPRGRRLLEETVRRYKNAYHGIRAREALARLGGPATPQPALLADASGTPPELPEPRGSRLRQLLLVDRLEEAADELGLLPESTRGLATLAWIDWRRGRLRPAIIEMKRAHPEWVTEAGDRLPPEVWRILFPLRYDAELRSASQGAGLDAALVASVILQESTFDAGALSRAGARGLMQVMPSTGRKIARAKGQRFRRSALHNPNTSLDFGTHYLRQMSDLYDGSVEKVLAAYNAGPHRVDAWVARRGERSPEEFIETIPFSETRTYVMIILAAREQYRRLYGLGRAAPGPAIEGPRP
jgi:soluble lytic murein transglycosylase